MKRTLRPSCCSSTWAANAGSNSSRPTPAAIRSAQLGSPAAATSPRPARVRTGAFPGAGHEPSQGLGNRQWLGWIDVLPEGAGDLDRVEWVPTGDGVNAQLGGASEDPVELRPEQFLHCAEAQRADINALERVGCHGAFEFGRACAALEPPSEHQQDWGAEPPTRERQSTRRRAVEPLDVVDGDDDRAGSGRQREGVADCDAEGARVDAVPRFAEQKRRLQGPPTGGDSDGRTSSTMSSKRSPSPAKASCCSVSSRARGEDTKSTSARFVNGVEPQRRLADPRLTLEYDRRAAPWDPGTRSGCRSPRPCRRCPAPRITTLAAPSVRAGRFVGSYLLVN